MKKIKDSLTMYLLLGIVVGIITFGGYVLAAILFAAEDVKFDKTNKNLLVSDNVQDAIDELYNKCKVNVHAGEIFLFFYTGNYQTFTAPYTGKYQVQLWGGGGYNSAGGAYTSGIIELTAGEKLYVYVGRNTNTSAGTKTFNAGTGNGGGWQGGGATDVRYFASTPSSADLAWDSFNGRKARIMVAAGAGSGNGGTAGAGGGLIGYNGGTATGGTQTAAGTKQASGYTDSAFGIANGGCTGGNGYYPGGGATCANGAPGGSSYISGHTGCNSISSSSTSSSITHTGSPNHYSGKIFTNTVMIDGKGYEWNSGSKGSLVKMPNTAGTGTMTGNTGNGYAKITFLGA